MACLSGLFLLVLGVKFRPSITTLKSVCNTQPPVFQAVGKSKSHGRFSLLQGLLQLSFLATTVITGLHHRKGFKPPYRLAALKNRANDLSKRWFVEFYAYDEAADELARKVIYISSSKYPTAKERRAYADAVIRQINHELSSGGFFRASNNKDDGLKTLAREYIRSREAQSKTIKDHKSTLFTFFIPWMEKQGNPLDVPSTTKSMVLAWLDDMQQERKWSNQTRNAKRSHLHSFYEYLRQREFVEVNPVADVQTETAKPEIRYYPFRPEDLEKIMSFLEENDKEMKLFCQFIYYCFLRPRRELRLLTVGDIIQERKQLRIRKDIAKSRKTMYVMIPPAFLKIIQQSGRLSFPPNYYLFGVNGIPGPQAYGYNTFAARFDTYMTKLGYDNRYRMYSFKHTGCCNLYRLTKDIKLIKEQCRHASIEHTDIYLRALGMYAEDAQRLKDFI